VSGGTPPRFPFSSGMPFVTLHCFAPFFEPVLHNVSHFSKCYVLGLLLVGLSPPPSVFAYGLFSFYEGFFKGGCLFLFGVFLKL